MGGCCVGNCCVANCCIMDNAFGDFFRDLFGDDSTGSCGYHPSATVTESHAKKTADELAVMKESIRESTEKKEKEIIDYIDRSMNSLIKDLRDMNRATYGGKSLNINIEGIREKSEKLKKEVVGYIGNVMDEKLVLTDKELSMILEERDDEKRTKNFKAFCKKVQKKSLSGLVKKIEDTVKQQEAMIRKDIESRMSEVDKSMQEAMRAYTEILNQKQQDNTKMEETQIKYIYQYELASILLEQAEN